MLKSFIQYNILYWNSPNQKILQTYPELKYNGYPSSTYKNRSPEALIECVQFEIPRFLPIQNAEWLIVISNAAFVSLISFGKATAAMG